MRTANTILASALAAIIARIDGVFDDPALVDFGTLSTSVDDDIEEIVTRSLDAADSLDAVTVRMRDLLMRFQQPKQRAEYLDSLKALAQAQLETNARRAAAHSPWKPIATAPKDRTILVACYGGEAAEAHWYPEGHLQGWYRSGEEPNDYNGFDTSDALNPDVWMDLPTAPAKPA